MLSTVLQKVNSILQRELKLLTWMQSTTQYTRWLATKLDTEKHSKDCLRDISAKQTLSADAIASAVIKLPIRNVTFPVGSFLIFFLFSFI